MSEDTRSELDSRIGISGISEFVLGRAKEVKDRLHGEYAAKSTGLIIFANTDRGLFPDLPDGKKGNPLTYLRNVEFNKRNLGYFVVGATACFMAWAMTSKANLRHDPAMKGNEREGQE